ncbi:MAG: winged helix-turn-helix transcriptional regulator [Ruminiclostridium sp.]|nr:winged helix-turn-helix transcriptional regulator [Ruminiclostridium sp.]
MSVNDPDIIIDKEDAEICGCNMIHEDVVKYVRSKMLPQVQFEKLSMFFKAISDETRIKLLFSLSRSKMCVCDLAALLGMTVSAISHQLRVLKQAGLVRSEKQGKVVYYMLSDDHVNTVFNNAIEHIME